VTEASLGIDIGTSATKAVLAGPAGEILAQAEVEHGMDLPAPGRAEQDAELTWWGDVLIACRAVTARAPEAEVAAVTVSGLGPCLVACDAQVRPVRPAILYGIDTRAEAEITELTARLGPGEIVRRGGSALSSQAVGPKIAWLRRHEPEAWARTRFVHSAHDFVTHRLTGEYVLDHHTASQFDPLYDMAAGGWNTEWAAEVAGDVPLPRLVWPGEVVGPLTPEAARLTGLAAGTPVVAGTVDAWAEALSAGVRGPGDLMVMYGSTMFLVLYAERAAFHPALWCTAGVFPGTRTYAAGMATSGSLMRWLSGLTGLGFAAADQAAAAIPAGADGLICLPYFAGERSPLFDPAARGAFAGLTLRHGAGHLVRAGYEAVAYGVRHNLEVMAGLGVVPARAVAVGGGTKGGLWTQIVSDVTGLPQQIPAVTIGAAYGDAMLGAAATGMTAGTASWNPVADTVLPDPSARPAYDAAYATYRELGQLITPVSHTLAATQEQGAPEPARAPLDVP
jgi:xylulokinase